MGFSEYMNFKGIPSPMSKGVVGRCSIMSKTWSTWLKNDPLEAGSIRQTDAKKIPYSFNLWVSLRREIALEFGLKQD